MSIRTRLILLSLFVGLSIAVVSFLFSSALFSIEKIDKEKSYLTTLADSVRDVSIYVNALDSNQYDGIRKKFQAAVEKSEKAFADLSQITVLPKLSDALKNAFEIIGNLHALIADDLKTVDAEYAALQPDLEKTFFESRSTTVRQFYTSDHINRKDFKDVYKKIDDLITTINGLTETLTGITDTINDQSAVIETETASIRDQSLVSALSISGGILLLIVLISFLLGTSISRRVKDMRNRLLPVSQGDFSHDLPVRGTDEVAGITKAVNHLLDSLNRLLREVQTQVESLNILGSDLSSKMQESTSAVEKIRTNLQASHAELESQTHAVSQSLGAAQNLTGLTNNLSESFKTQMEILSSSSAGIEEIIANIGSVNANAAKAETSSQILKKVSQDGQIKLDLVAQSVREIARSSENLVQVTAIINDIADKTNLLAMNASIEAAHAGNSGRGFGVVAGEIRKLAEQAASQSKEISKDLHNVNENIASIQSAMVEAVEVFRNIVAQTAQVSSIVQEVQTSMDEQNRGGTLVLDGIQKLHQINDQVGKDVQSMKTGDLEIQAQIQELAVQNVRVNENNEAVSQRTLEIIEIIQRTNALADSTRKLIETLELETDQFKTREQELEPEAHLEPEAEPAPEPQLSSK